MRYLDKIMNIFPQAEYPEPELHTSAGMEYVVAHAHTIDLPNLVEDIAIDEHKPETHWVLNITPHNKGYAVWQNNWLVSGLKAIEYYADMGGRGDKRDKSLGPKPQPIRIGDLFFRENSTVLSLAYLLYFNEWSKKYAIPSQIDIDSSFTDFTAQKGAYNRTRDLAHHLHMRACFGTMFAGYNRSEYS